VLIYWLLIPSHSTQDRDKANRGKCYFFNTYLYVNMIKKGTYKYKYVENWSKKAGIKVDLITRLDCSFYLYARLSV
jgi:hypothetical protein